MFYVEIENGKPVTKVLTTEQSVTLSSWIPHNWRFGSWETCFYCGDLPGCQDHVIPWSFSNLIAHHKGSDPGLKTPACKDCNNRLSGALFFSLSERCDHLRLCLQKKLADLNTPEWKVNEIRKLQHGLRQHVQSKQLMRRRLLKRIAWQDSQAFADLAEESFLESKRVYVSNKTLHTFMRPKWMNSDQS